MLIVASLPPRCFSNAPRVKEVAVEPGPSVCFLRGRAPQYFDHLGHRRCWSVQGRKKCRESLGVQLYAPWMGQHVCGSRRIGA